MMSYKNDGIMRFYELRIRKGGIKMGDKQPFAS